MTRFIENCFETEKFTGVVFIGLREAYDVEKINRLIKDTSFTQIIQIVLQDKIFYVTLGSKIIDGSKIK